MATIDNDEYDEQPGKDPPRRFHAPRGFLGRRVGEVTTRAERTLANPRVPLSPPSTGRRASLVVDGDGPWDPPKRSLLGAPKRQIRWRQVDGARPSPCERIPLAQRADGPAVLASPRVVEERELLAGEHPAAADLALSPLCTEPAHVAPPASICAMRRSMIVVISDASPAWTATSRACAYRSRARVNRSGLSRFLIMLSPDRRSCRTRARACSGSSDAPGTARI